MSWFKYKGLVRFDIRLASARTRSYKVTENFFDQRNIYILTILYPSLVRHSPWILLSTTSYSTSISGSITASCHSLCLDDLVCPSFLGCLAIYNLAFAQVRFGDHSGESVITSSSGKHLAYLFCGPCSFDGAMTIDSPPRC
jgi:hypothetical protein